MNFEPMMNNNYLTFIIRAQVPLPALNKIKNKCLKLKTPRQEKRDGIEHFLASCLKTVSTELVVEVRALPYMTWKKKKKYRNDTNLLCFS